jgi:hypothetical protein
MYAQQALFFKSLYNNGQQRVGDPGKIMIMIPNGDYTATYMGPFKIFVNAKKGIYYKLKNGTKMYLTKNRDSSYTAKITTGMNIQNIVAQLIEDDRGQVVLDK